MAVKIKMEMPGTCQDCLLCRDKEITGKCQALPIRDLDGEIIGHQTVSLYYTRTDGSQQDGRSEHCPLKECAK